MEKVLTRISPLGLALLVLGALLAYLATPIAKKVFTEKWEKWVLPLKFAGLLLVVIAMVITLKLV
jgi:hypothetical protein